jgi:lysophospholipase L1-like esterase
MNMKKHWLFVLIALSVVLNIIFITRFVIRNYPKQKQVSQTGGTFKDFCRDVYNNCPNDSGEIIFLGNSLTYSFNVSEFFPDLMVKNRGIRGDMTTDILDRLGEITESKPAKIFLLIGTNDILRNVPTVKIIENIKQIIKNINRESPATKIYLQSLLPITHHASASFLGDENLANHSITEINSALRTYCEENSLPFIDLNSTFRDKDQLNEIYSWDGLHINGQGYRLWYELIRPFVVER